MKKIIRGIAIVLSASMILSLIPALQSFADDIDPEMTVEQNVVTEEETTVEYIEKIPEEEFLPAEPDVVPVEENVPYTEEPIQIETPILSTSVVNAETGSTEATRSSGIRPEEPFDNSTSLNDGTYPVDDAHYSFRGGTGKAKLTVKEVTVENGKATAVFTASSANMTHVYLGTVNGDLEDPSIYDPATGEKGINVYQIVNQQVTLPVRVNEEIAFAARSTAMTEPHWIQYYYTITIDEDGGSDDEEQTADYSAVDAALNDIPADLSKYTPESVAALETAKKAVVRDKPASAQAEVDAMAKAIRDAIAALELIIEDGRIDLAVTNNVGMFNVVSAYLQTNDGKTEMVIALNGTGYRELYKGTYEQASANGYNTNNWLHGKANAAGKLEFHIPVGSGETYIPCVAISQSYLDKYIQGKNTLERAFYPRQFELDAEAKTLVVSDYEFNQTLSIINNVTMFVPQTAVITTVGGPNSNSYKSDLMLTMGSDSFDKVCYGTKDQAASAEQYPISGRTFAIPVRWVEVFGQPETMKTVIGSTVVLSFHSVKKDEWYERKMTINEENGTVTFDEVTEEDPSGGGDTPTPSPTPTPGGDDDDKPSGGDSGGSTAAVDNTTSLADGVYTPDRFSFSGGSGRIVITCSKVEVIGGKAYATIVFQNIRSGSTEMNYVKASGGIYYCSQSGGASVVTIPVELNKNNRIVALTTKMSAAHEIEYTIFIYIAGADAKKGGGLTNNDKFDTEAPVIAGLEYQDEEKLDYAEYFKVFNYSEGVRLLEIDMRLKDEDQEKKTNNDNKADSPDEDTEIESEAEEEVVIDEETGAEMSIVASKADAQAELYKGNVVKYLLVPEGVEIPAGLDKEAIVIEIPADSVYSGSDEISKIMDELKVKDKITSQAKEEKDNQDILAAGDYKDLDLKALIKSKADLVLLPNDVLKDKKEKKEFESLAEDLANLDIAVIVDRAEMEKTDNAKAEWLKVYGILFGCEKEAAAAFENAVK